jgi:Zn-dependent protease with chaperone function
MSDPEKTSDNRPVALALLVVLGGAAAGLQASTAPSRESLLPALRVVQEQGKGLDRAAGAALPLTPEQERAEGELINGRLRAAAGDTAAQGFVRELAPVALRSPLARRYQGRYEIGVYDSPTANAFALPGGFIWITSTLAERLRGDENALLFVIGHELGHVEVGHCADTARLRFYGRQLKLVPLAGVAEFGRTLASLSFSESQELEADAFAVKLLSSLGRDPSAGLRAFDALGLTEQAAGVSGPLRVPEETLTDYFRTHPGAWERRTRLKLAVARAQHP